MIPWTEIPLLVAVPVACLYLALHWAYTREPGPKRFGRPVNDNARPGASWRDCGPIADWRRKE